MNASHSAYIRTPLILVRVAGAVSVIEVGWVGEKQQDTHAIFCPLRLKGTLRAGFSDMLHVAARKGVEEGREGESFGVCVVDKLFPSTSLKNRSSSSDRLNKVQILWEK